MGGYMRTLTAFFAIALIAISSSALAEFDRKDANGHAKRFACLGAKPKFV